MALLVLAYPAIAKSDYDTIQRFRREHDDLFYHVVEPHFTLVFPLFDWAGEPFIAEIRKQAQGMRPFEFCLRCATLNKDAFNAYYHTFLVPDEGYSHIVKLHDTLYAGKLFEQRRLDIDFIPHLGIGNAKDAMRCHAMVQHWNHQEFAISGRIKQLDIVNYDNDTIQTLDRIILGV